MSCGISTGKSVLRAAFVSALIALVFSRGVIACEPEPDPASIEVDLYDAVTSGKVSVSLIFPGANVDLFGPQEGPYDARLTLRKESETRSDLRVVIKSGTVIEGSGNSVVLLDPVTVEFSEDGRVEEAISVRAYRQRLPARTYSMGRDFVRPREGYRYVHTIPDLLAASDSVRQAAVWISGNRVTYGKYSEIYSTEYAGESGTTVTRTNPFRITRAQWSEAQRIIEVITPARQRELDAEAVEIARRLEESARVRAESKREAKALAEEAARLKADREARTRTVSLQQVLAEGLVTISVDALRIPPAKVELRIVPTPALGSVILDVLVPGGTTLREASGASDARVGYLGRGFVRVEGTEATTVELRSYVRTLDDAGPGDFIVGQPEPFAAVLLGSGLWRSNPGAQSGQISKSTSGRGGRYGRGNNPQMAILIHWDKGKAWQEWKREFASLGIDDPYEEAEWGLSPATIHRSIQTFVALHEKRAERVTAPDGSTYSDAYIIGGWRSVSGSTAVRFFAGEEADRREWGAILRRIDQTPDLTDFEATIRGEYQRILSGVRKEWKDRPGHTSDPIEMAYKLKFGMPAWAISFNADHTFEVVFADTRGVRMEYGVPVLLADTEEIRFKHRGNGSWTWDGLKVRLDIAADPGWHSYWDQFEPVRLQRGVLIVQPSIHGKRKGQRTMVLSRVSGRRAVSGAVRQRTAKAKAKPAIKASSDEPKRPIATATHVLTMYDGRVIRGRLISMDEREVRFVLMVGGISGETVYKRDEVASVREIKKDGEPPPPSTDRRS